MEDLSLQQYVRLTTFTKEERPEHTPVWIAGIDGGRLGFLTRRASSKVAHIKIKSIVALTASDATGIVQDTDVTFNGTAKIVNSDHVDYTSIASSLLSKVWVSIQDTQGNRRDKQIAWTWSGSLRNRDHVGLIPKALSDMGSNVSAILLRGSCGDRKRSARASEPIVPSRHVHAS